GRRCLCQAASPRETAPPGAALDASAGREAVVAALLRSEALHRALRAQAPDPAPVRRAREPGYRIPTARVALRGMVLAGRRAGHRPTLLPGAPAARAARAAHHARGGRRQFTLVHAHPAP